MYNVQMNGLINSLFDLCKFVNFSCVCTIFQNKLEFPLERLCECECVWFYDSVTYRLWVTVCNEMKRPSQQKLQRKFGINTKITTRGSFVLVPFEIGCSIFACALMNGACVRASQTDYMYIYRMIANAFACFNSRHSLNSSWALFFTFSSFFSSPTNKQLTQTLCCWAFGFETNLYRIDSLKLV